MNSENKENLSNYQPLKRKPSFSSTSLHFSKLITVVDLFFPETPVLHWFQWNFSAGNFRGQRPGTSALRMLLRLTAVSVWRLVPEWELCSVYMILVSLFIPLWEFRTGTTTGMNSYRNESRTDITWTSPIREGGGCLFFFNRTQLQDYMKASESSKASVPGDNFSAKICNSINDHYVVRELYVKFIKGILHNCKIKKEQGWALCTNGWQSPKIINNIIIYRFLERHILKALWRFTILKIYKKLQKTIKSLSKKKIDRITRPFPNKETFRYKSVFELPSTCLDRKTRPVDDFMPRAQTMKYLNKEKLNMAKDMDELPCALVFSQEIVKNYVEHLKYLKFSKDLGDNTTAEKQGNRRNRVAKKI